MTIEQQEKFERIKSNLQYGDYNLLERILDAKTVAAARQRFLRGDEDAIAAMESIQENREEFVKKYKEQNNQQKVIS